MAASQTNLNTAVGLLTPFYYAPTFSVIDVVSKRAELFQAYTSMVIRNGAQTHFESSDVKFKGNQFTSVITKAADFLVCYKVIQVATQYTCWYHLAVGGAKCALAAIVAMSTKSNSTERKFAAELLEMGTFHLVTGATEYLISQIQLISFVAAAALALLPKDFEINDVLDRLISWKGPINDSFKPRQIQATYSKLQEFANYIQKGLIHTSKDTALTEMLNQVGKDDGYQPDNLEFDDDAARDFSPANHRKDQ